MRILTELSGLVLYRNTQSAQDWPGIGTHRVLRIGQVLEHTECTGLGRYEKTQRVPRTSQVSKHTECPKLPRYKNTHRVHKTG